tara:strand:- start:67 stop:273 length:207 start_codon:yes stop_codon:yes gene_type:complete
MTEVFFTIMLLVTIGMMYSSYKIGRREGAEACLEVLHKNKVICYDNKGNIKPNPFFDHDPWVNVEEEL